MIYVDNCFCLVSRVVEVWEGLGDSMVAFRSCLWPHLMFSGVYISERISVRDLRRRLVVYTVTDHL